MTTHEAKARLLDPRVYPWKLTPKEHYDISRGETAITDEKKTIIDRLERQIAELQRAIEVIKGL